MALKRKLSKEEFDALPDVLKAEYKQKGDSYTIDLTGTDEAFEALKTEKGELKTKVDALTTDLTARQEELDNMRRGAIPKADVEALENSWKTKLTAKETELNAVIAKRETAIKNLTVDAVSQSIATEISTSPDLLAPVIRGRLAVDLDADSPVVKVLDSTGKPSALTVAELSAELKGDAKYAPIIIGSQASGGGANGKNGAGGSGSKKLAEMNDAERTDFYKRDPAGFKKAVAEQNQSSE